MRAVFGLVLVAGVGLAGFAVLKVKEQVDGYRGALAQANAARVPAIATTDVFVVKQRISYGEQLTAEHVKIIKWPSDSLPEGVFSSIDDLFPEGAANYRSVSRVMEINEPVLAVKVTAPGEEVGIQSQLSPGMRAFAIKVDAVSGVSGFLRPGDLVDVYWTGSSDGEGVTQLIQNALRIIAIDQEENAEELGATIARTVTVEVSRQQVSLLAQAQASGRLNLSLLNVNEAGDPVDQNEVIVTRTGDLLGERVQDERCYISQGFGANKTQIEVPCTE